MKQSYRTAAIAASGALLAAVAANIIRQRSRARAMAQTVTVVLQRDVVASALLNDAILTRAMTCDAVEVRRSLEPDVFEWKCAGHGERHHARLALIDAPGGRGTELHLSMHAPKIDAKEVVRRLKYLLESGEIPTGAYTA